MLHTHIPSKFLYIAHLKATVRVRILIKTLGIKTQIKSLKQFKNNIKSENNKHQSKIASKINDTRCQKADYQRCVWKGGLKWTSEEDCLRRCHRRFHNFGAATAKAQFPWAFSSLKEYAGASGQLTWGGDIGVKDKFVCSWEPTMIHMSLFCISL